MIKYFTIYGERCSGTNFLEKSILENFDIEYSIKYGWKHFFGFHKFINDEEENNTLFIGIIRDPVQWIDSFYKKLHHIPPENKHNINTFLFNEFYSVQEKSVIEVMEDRNMNTNERYKNIFELRNIKNNFLTTVMKKNVKSYLLIRYEDLRDKYETVLDFIKNRFNLIKKYDTYKRIYKYKGFKNHLFYIKNIELDDNTIKKIKNNLNKEQEKGFGY